jgi:hypothetical protein
MWRIHGLPVKLGRPGEGEFDFYILDQTERDFIAKRGLRLVLEDPVSGALLAEAR